MSESAQTFELVFEGPTDSSPETMRRLRGAFIAELECTIEETARALQQFPVTIKTADNAEALTNYLNAIKNAGGRVLIVKPRAATTAKDRAAEEEAIAKNLEIQEMWATEDHSKDHVLEPVQSGAVKNIEIEFELNTEDLAAEASSTPPPLEKTKPTAVFQLDENSDLNAVLQEVVNVVEKSPLPEVSLPPDDKVIDIEVPPAIDLVLDAPEIDLTKELSAPLPTEPKPSHTEAPKIDFSFELEGDAAPTPLPPAPVEAASPAAPAASAMDPVSFALEIAEEPTPIVEKEAPPQPEPDLTINLATDVEPPPAIIAKSAEPEPPPVLCAPPAPIEAKPEVHDEVDDVALRDPSPAATTEPEELDDPSLAQDPVEGSIPTKSHSSFLGKKVRIRLDIVGPIVLGAIVLGGVNWWIFTQGEMPRPSVEQLTQADIGKDVVKAIKPSPVPPPSTIAGSVSSNGFERSWKAVTVGDKLRTIDIMLIPPAPPGLTLEEIGQGILPPVAIRKMELTGLTVENLQEGGFRAQGPALLALDDAGTMTRAVGQAMVTGTINEKEKSVTFKIDAWTQTPPDAEFNGVAIERTETGYDLRFRVAN